MSLTKKVFSTVCLGVAMTASAMAQSSSINTFSPYTFYGLGDFSQQGSAQTRAMGGASVAFRSPIAINYTNPASFSAINRKSSIFNFGMEGKNFYLKQGSKKTSYNTFNVRDVALQLPLYSKIGIGISVTPYTNVGYRVMREETNPEIVSEGRMQFLYDGDGGVTQFKLGIGVEVIKNVSLGVDMVYYLGSINREFSSVLTSTIGSSSFNSVYGTDAYKISKMSVNFGLQANVYTTEKRIVTVGATFQPKVKFNQKVTRSITSSNMMQDSVSSVSYRSPLSIPATFAVGAYYHSVKFGTGFDYTFQKWKGLNPADELNNLSFANVHTLKGGVEYTPNRGDIRNFMNRITYRAGLRYGTNYLMLDGNKTTDRAVTAGLGIPIKFTGMSNINVGVEYGRRGTSVRGGMKERYFMFSIGLSLFGEDFWFVKPQYD